MEEFKLRAKLYKKIEEISLAIGKVEKDGYNKSGKFAFITHGKMTTVMRGLLNEYNLSITMELIAYEEKDYTAKDRYGNEKSFIRSIATGLFTIVDTETGFQVEKRFIGADQDYTGKSMSQAATQCMKYFLFKTFKVTDQESDGDFKDSPIESEEPKTPPTAKKPASKPQTKKPTQKKPAGQPPVSKKEGLTVEQAVEKIKSCKSYNEIASVFRSVPEALRTEALTQACTARNEAIKLRRWEVPSKSKKDVKYIVARTGGDTFSCQCKLFQSKGTECSHIKDVKEAKHGEGKVD